MLGMLKVEKSIRGRALASTLTDGLLRPPFAVECVECCLDGSYGLKTTPEDTDKANSLRARWNLSIKTGLAKSALDVLHIASIKSRDLVSIFAKGYEVKIM